MIYDELIKFLIGILGITGLLGYLGRRYIDNYFSKSIERYKTDLEKIKFEHQIKFSKLHEERALVIKKLYEKLVKVEKSMGSFVAILEFTGELPKEEKGKIAAKDYNNFIDYFKPNEI